MGSVRYPAYSRAFTVPIRPFLACGLACGCLRSLRNKQYINAVNSVVGDLRSSVIRSISMSKTYLPAETLL